MALFSRQRRVGAGRLGTGRFDVGRFVAPPAVPPPPIDRVIDEGFMISLSAVRMALKNRIILGALREDRRYDLDVYSGIAREEFETLAAEHDDDAERVAAEYRAATRSVGRAQHQHDYGVADRDQLERRRLMHEGLASALRAFATNETHIRALVQQARDDAWHEIAASIEASLTASAHPEPADDDPTAKIARLDELRADLRLLAAQPPPVADY